MQKFSFRPDALLACDVSNRNVPCDYTPFPNDNIRPSTLTITTSASFRLLENTLTAWTGVKYQLTNMLCDMNFLIFLQICLTAYQIFSNLEINFQIVYNLKMWFPGLRGLIWSPALILLWKKVFNSNLSSCTSSISCTLNGLMFVFDAYVTNQAWDCPLNTFVSSWPCNDIAARRAVNLPLFMCPTRTGTGNCSNRTGQQDNCTLHTCCQLIQSIVISC